MKKHITLAALVLLSQAASANELIALGKWKNVNPETNGMVELDIQKYDQKLFINAWGSCSPTNCEWGETDFHMLSSAVGKPPLAQAIARWDNDFSQRTFTFKAEGRKLLIESFVVFTDDSGRSPYKQSYIFMQDDTNHQ